MPAKKTLLEKQNKPGRDIQHILELWGAWAANKGGSVYYSPIAAGFKGLLPCTRKSRASCSDDDGLIISSAMNVLKKKNPYLCTLLELYYIKCMPLRAMAGKLGISHNQVSVRLQTAEGFIDGCLAALGVALEMDLCVQHEPVVMQLTGTRE
ncbi:antiterminator Q family protein [Yersinia similis]|uniref:Putative phage antitermination protein n=1 Tax=Yersinia similis TaxID=367190 RepID=A0A0T9R8I0_9GAMM|nr:antiterminator Q family protein [Yersinia similis]CNC23021.1 putative phage antitermination protein [Yersinia similis]CNG01291.1 putative phage antitermination protein [Yersinia similis]CNI50056.1 putative phage antitermination protein [Yersinia similis]